MLMPDTCMADTDILWDMEAMADTAWEDTEDMVDTVTVLDTGAMVTIMARDPLMPNLKLMPEICMVDMEVMEAMVMAVDTDIAALVTMEDMVDTVLDTGATVSTTVRDLLMPNLKLMPDICMADTAMEDMEAMDMVDMVLDTEDMAVSGDKHSQVVQPTSSRN